MFARLLFIGFYCLLIPGSIFSQTFVGPGKAVDPYNFSSKKTGFFNSGAVVCAHPLAAKVGLEILKRGGNVMDAAIATQLALAVVYPGAGNLGGGGFLLARMKDGKNFTLDFRETAPAKSSRDMYIDDSGNARTDLSQYGHLASGVPGTVAGLFQSVKYARLPFKILIQPAIELAEKGFTLTEAEADKLNKARDAFLKYNSIKPVFIKNRSWHQGDTLIQRDLAKTLKRIRDKGAAGFYEGVTAKLIVEEMKRGKGFITINDLKNYKAKVRKPIEFNYKGYTVLSMPPPSSGGILLMQMLRMVEDRPLNRYGFHTIKSVQLMTEVERRAYADRAQHLGDPDFWKVPVEVITSRSYLAKRMADFDSVKAGTNHNIKAGAITESTETTHISIADKWGNVASVTTTLNGNFGSKTVVGGAGFFLNNEMDDFSVKPGVPNMYGAIGGEANAIAPGKRMLSSMTPTIVLKGKQPFLVVGTPGGTTIPTSIFQTIVNVIDFKMNAEYAVNKPKFHHQWVPDEVMVEQGFPEDVTKNLQQMGYKINGYNVTGYAVTIGRVELIKITGGRLEAAADKRGEDSAEGY